MSAVCHFPDLESAVLTAQEIIQYGVPIARIEMLNKDQMEISINYSKLENLEAKPTLFYEFHGSETFLIVNLLMLLKKFQKIIMEMNSSGHKIQKKETNYGKPGMKFIIQ